MKLLLITTGLLVFSAALVAENAFSADLQWSGRYRAEGTFIKNYTLSNASSVEDSYIIHHLVLEPKIIATDGLWIKSRFDVFNNAIPNNQLGQVFGTYTNNYTTTGIPQAKPGVLSHTGQSDTIAVNALYMNWVNEFSSLTIGRVPFNFGLGMLYSAGNGNFDHFMTNKDMVAYKLALGNLSITPAYGKVREGVLTNEDDINDFIIMADYTNSESGLSMGVIFDNRVAPADGTAPTNGNDMPPNYFARSSPNFGAALPVTDGYNAYNMNFFVKKESDAFNVGVELGFVNGYSGIQVNNLQTGGIDRVNVSGFGVATELGYKAGDWNWELHSGLASGDDPDTANFEGYFFNPNYNVAMMMFNYPMGQYDALRSTLAGSRPVSISSTGSAAVNGLDTEVISNAVYVSPSVKWAVGERYEIQGTACYGMTMKPGLSPSTAGGGTNSNSLGFETDFGLNYHPNDRFTWVTTFGLLLPGKAFAGPNGNAYATDLAYGATSKAVINF